MAITSIGTIGTGTSTSSGTTLTLTTATNALAIGNVGILTIAKDNVQTTDGNTSEVTSITDGAGNTWAIIDALTEYCNGQGGAGAGAVVSVWMSKITATLSIGTVITINFSSAITAKAVTGWGFATSGTLEVAGTVQNLANDGADPGSMTVSGLVSGEYLFVRGIANEKGGTEFTPTTNFTAFTVADAGNNAMAAVGEFYILTGTSATSDPTNEVGDVASVFFALKSTGSGGSFFQFF